MRKNLIVGFFLIILIITALISILNKKPSEKLLDRKDKYIKDCIKAINTSKIANKQKIDICNCSFDSLYYKYGDTMFEETFVFSKADSVMMMNCAIKNLKIDSIKN
jgi:hypothetical protein